MNDKNWRPAKLLSRHVAGGPEVDPDDRGPNLNHPSIGAAARDPKYGRR